MFCCNMLRNLISEAGNRGLSVLLRSSGRELRFELQMRALASEDESRVVAELKKAPLPVTNLTLSASICIKYCPGCGARLESLVQENRTAFESLAETSVAHLNKMPVVDTAK